ncbi:MAG TPA: hypothetical protein VNP36_16850 [Burkholderiales bacterium]|nr:hypothetical protein [Burkholderiales bacterium]
MTFYSILFAVAFLASVQDLFLALFTRSLWHLPFPAVVSVLVFIDTIYTTHYMESKGPDYGLTLKMLDLLGVLFLLLALTVLSPDTNSFVKVGSSAQIFGFSPHASFWLSLSLYFAVTIVWHLKAGIPPSNLSYGIVVLMLVACGLSFFKQDGVDAAVAVVILMVLVVYLVMEQAGVKPRSRSAQR